MSTFEKAQARIMRDMASIRVHDGMTWANIMLKHTTQLTSLEEQKKFWNWMTNPSDADIDKTMEWEPVPEPVDIDGIVTAPEDGTDIELVNEMSQNGLCTYVSTVPKIRRKMSGLTLSDLTCVDEEDEKAEN